MLGIFAGREGIRGQTGGSEAVTLESGDARLAVPAGALFEDTAIWVQGVEPSPFLPSSAGLVLLGEVVVDFSGSTLSLGSELSIADPGVSPDDTLLVTRVVHLDGIPFVEVVGLAQLVNGFGLTLDRPVKIARLGVSRGEYRQPIVLLPAGQLHCAARVPDGRGSVAILILGTRGH